MVAVHSLARSGRIAVAFALALFAAACAQTPDPNAAGGAATPGSQQDFVVNVGDRVLFAADSTDLSSEATAVLGRQAAWLRQYNRYAITIEGHADERGTREYNIALGARRAAAVRDFLTSRGIETSRLRTISYGKERPVAVCDNESCWNQNRRAVSVLSGAGS